MPTCSSSSGCARRRSAGPAWPSRSATASTGPGSRSSTRTSPTSSSRLVLCMVGTEEVKGFALTMIIGMVWNLFTAVFVSRVIFEFCYSEGLAQEGDDDEDDGQDQHRLHRPALLLHGRLADLDRPGADRAPTSAGQSMFNIDFTGGTLVTIRLNEDDPERQDAVASRKRAEFVRAEGRRALPDVTVESLRVGGDKSLTRFNIRTTEQKPEQVKTGDPRGVRLEPGPRRDDRRRRASRSPASPPTAGEDGRRRRRSPVRGRPGVRCSTSTRRPSTARQSPAQVVSAEFVKVLDAGEITNPETRFEIRRHRADGGGQSPARRRAGTRLILRTDLEPDVAKAAAREAQGVARRTTATCSSSGSTNFGSTVAGETRNLALIATVASWLIIIAYLWWRFKSFTYGLAAVLAVVHDVLDHPGRGRRQLLAGHDPRGQQLPPDRTVQDRPADRRGLPDPDRLLGQRHDRHLRPHPRDQGEDAVPDQQDGQRRDQPDPEPDDPDVVHRLARRGDPLLLRRRRAARVRLRPGRRLPERHLQHGLHRHPDPDRLRRRPSRGRPPRPASSWPPSRS